MTNKEKYEKVFIESFEVASEQLSNLTYQSIPLWDSVGHMNLIASIEDAFDIMMETDDIIDFSAYEKGLAILSEKYDVQF
ncbi:acyl carrier protein [Bacteroidia bacterium]|nr:acyl carrier protein [Bacteroidia bacterium]